MNYFKAIIFLFALISAIFSSCEKSNEDEQELITDIEWTFTDSIGGLKTFVFSDSDGDGGQNPTIDTIKLSANSEFLSSLRFFDKSKTPIIDITDEIIAEAEAHLVIFKNNSGQLAVEYLDKDGQNQPLGLQTKIKTPAPGQNNWTVILRHEPTDKNNTANPGGETDVEITFPVVFK